MDATGTSRGGLEGVTALHAGHVEHVADEGYELHVVTLL